MIKLLALFFVFSLAQADYVDTDKDSYAIRTTSQSTVALAVNQHIDPLQVVADTVAGATLSAAQSHIGQQLAGGQMTDTVGVMTHTLAGGASEVLRQFPSGHIDSHAMVVSATSAGATKLLMNTFAHPNDTIRRSGSVEEALEQTEAIGKLVQFGVASTIGLVTQRAEDVDLAAGTSSSVVQNNCVPQLILRRALMVGAGALTVKGTIELTQELADAYQAGGVEAVALKAGEAAVIAKGVQVLCAGTGFVVASVGGKIICYTPQCVKEVTRTCVAKLGDKFYKLMPQGAQEITRSEARVLQRELRQNQAAARQTLDVLGERVRNAGAWQARPGQALRADAIPEGSKLEYLGRPGFVRFDGVEFRGVRDLGHLSEAQLDRMFRKGINPKGIDNIRLDGHHHLQRYHREPGAFVAEIPEPNHCISNRIQHPLGTSGGLTKEQRSDWDALRLSFNKERARAELIKRGIRNE